MLDEGWERYLIAEQHALVARAEGILARSLVEALPGESQEELDHTAEEDRRLAREGLVELMDEEGETYHKHLEELDPWDVADRVRAATARSDWLAMRTQQRRGHRKVRQLSGRDRTERRRPSVSERELEMLKGLARGLSNRLLAKEVHLSESTVKRHLANIYERIGARSRGEAVAKGVTEGWLVLDDIVSEDTASAEIASDREHTTAGGRYRREVEGCGREVLVVRDSWDAAHRGAPTCHDHKMRPVGSPVPENEGPPTP